MNNIYTALAINKNTGLISKLLGGLIVAFIIIYLYQINIIINAMLVAKQDSTKMEGVRDEYQTLEENYLGFSESLTSAQVSDLGFVPQDDGTVVVRSDNVVARR
jgi:hypothetical protein